MQSSKISFEIAIRYQRYVCFVLIGNPQKGLSPSLSVVGWYLFKSFRL